LIGALVSVAIEAWAVDSDSQSRMLAASHRQGLAREAYTGEWRW
jgi:hypothetical protein